MIFRNFQGKSSGFFQVKFGSKFGPDLMPIYAVNGLQITHVNLFSINYGGQIRDIFQGNLVVDLVVDFGGHLRCKWPVSGSHFTHVNLFSINYGT